MGTIFKVFIEFACGHKLPREENQAEKSADEEQGGFHAFFGRGSPSSYMSPFSLSTTRAIPLVSCVRVHPFLHKSSLKTDFELVTRRVLRYNRAVTL